MSGQSCVQQAGIIEKLTSKTASIRFSQHAACGSCSAKQLCGATESNQNLVEVEVNNNQFFVGEEVMLCMKRSLGLKAVLIAYVVPFMLVVATLLFLQTYRVHELITGLVSLLLLIPYFFVLYHFNDKLKRTFTFSVSKVNS